MLPNFFNLCPEWTDFFFSKEMEKIIKEDDTKYNYKPFYLSTFNSIKVVLITSIVEEKNELCFQVKKNELLTPLLEDIYKELEDEGFYPTKDGNLEHWAKQGILMLNINNYSKNFITKIKEKLEKEKKDLVWFFYSPNESNLQLNLELQKSLNSKVIYTIPFFLGSKIFKKINDHLIDKIIF